jgi:cyanate permease
MTSAIPVQFAKPGRTSSTTGIFNAAFNLGGGFAGVVVGGALGASGWMLVLLIWAVALVLALLLMGWFITRIKPATDAGDVGVRT